MSAMHHTTLPAVHLQDTQTLDRYRQEMVWRTSYLPPPWAWFRIGLPVRRRSVRAVSLLRLSTSPQLLNLLSRSKIDCR